ncbi:unconventional myosin-Vb-like [Gallus gallus]|uniref:unconventional myosin-Vb-like n=1 Tax=Gallus gallus TaxID=9031 RepID=UPI001F030D03|nr:unconventional myosin-Vb-like [Gallus gallus]XP_046790413.1 unconventional myosin-Vb-like [Gallus gallus]
MEGGPAAQCPTAAFRAPHGMLDYDPKDEALLIRRLITELDLTKMAAGVPCLPAYVLAMCIRRADDVNDARRMQSLLNASIAAIKDVTQGRRELALSSFWLANCCRLLQCLKQRPGSAPPELAALCEALYAQLCANADAALQPMVGSTSASWRSGCASSSCSTAGPWRPCSPSSRRRSCCSSARRAPRTPRPSIVKLLTLYSPVDEFEERVSVAFIRTVQAKLKDRDDPNQLLMDSKRTFPLLIPYNPTPVPLDSIRVPSYLNLDFLIPL